MYINAKTGVAFFDQIGSEPPMPGPTLYFSGTPNLGYICVDAVNTGFIQTKIDSYGYTGVALNTLCDDALPFPDPVLKAKLIAASPLNTTAQDIYGNYFTIDTNHDGEVNRGEAWKIRTLYVNNTETTPESEKIADMTGIANFPNLISFQCRYNKLVSLDVADIPTLIGMSCSYNQLTSINWADTLNGVDCAHNQLAALAPGLLENLNSINCSYNQLETLSFSANTNDFPILDCSHNQLTVLEVPSSFNSTAIFDCSHNQLTYLDITPMGQFDEFDSYGFIGISNNPLSVLRACIELPYYAEMDFSNLPNLTQIFALPVNNTQFAFEINQHQLTGATVNNDCALGSDEYPVPVLAVSPNPAKNFLSMHFTQADENPEYRITNMLGQILQAGRYSAEIDIAHLPPGYYIFTVISGESVSGVKFIKE